MKISFKKIGDGIHSAVDKVAELGLVGSLVGLTAFVADGVLFDGKYVEKPLVHGVVDAAFDHVKIRRDEMKKAAVPTVEAEPEWKVTAKKIRYRDYHATPRKPKSLAVDDHKMTIDHTASVVGSGMKM